MHTTKLNGDLAAGILFILFGGWFCGSSLLGLSLGSAFRMGPGFFPAVVGGLLIALGLIIALNGWMAKATEVDLATVPWRAVILFPVGLILFGAAMRPLGMVVALLLLCLSAAMGVKGMSLGRAALLSLAITAVCIDIFNFGLGINLPLVGDWLR